MFKSLKRGREFYSALMVFAVPIIFQNLIAASAGFIDTFMVGMLGQDEMAALTLAGTPFFIAYLLIFGLQSGSSVLISQYWGKRDKKTISCILGVCWVFAISISLIISAVIFFNPRAVMGLMTNNEKLIDIAARYGKIVSFSLVPNAFVTIYLGARRSCESPRFGTLVMAASVLSNVFFNYIFIFGKLGFSAMDVEGAALGTVLSRVVEIAVTLLYIFFGDRKKKIMPIYKKHLIRPGKLIIRDFIKYSSPVVLNELFWSVGTSLYAVVYGHMADSSDIMAALSLSGNVERLMTVVIFAIASGAAVFIGKAIGSNAERAEVHSLGKTFALLSFIVGFISGLMLIAGFFGVVKPFVFSLMSLTENAQRICIGMAVMMGCILAGRSFNTTLIVGILRGGGDVKFGLFLDTGVMYLWSIPAAVLAAFFFKLDILLVYPLVLSEELIKAFIGYRRFKTGKWIGNVTREIKH